MEKPLKEIIDNTESVSAFRGLGGRILHIRPDKNNQRRKRGVTFAFIHRGNRVEFSTALQHGHDEFTKKIGTKVALEHFQQGKTVTLPYYGLHIDNFFRFMY